MAEEFVRKEHFDEYVLRMDGRFVGIEKRLEQGFAYSRKGAGTEPRSHQPAFR